MSTIDYTQFMPKHATPTSPALETSIIKAYAVGRYGFEKPEKYLPAGCLDELMTLHAVREALSSGGMIFNSLPVETQRSLIEFIAENAKKLFAISILAGLKGNDLFLAMTTFHSHNFEDKGLPVPDPPAHAVF